MEVNAKHYLKQLEDQLLAADRIPMHFKRDWSDHFDKKAGVYAVFDKNKLVYVGETGNLKGRMKDIRRTVNHSFRRSLGKHLFENDEGFEPASSTKKFKDQFEFNLNEHCETNISVAALPIDLGRKELEEDLTAKYFDQLLNTRRRRK